MRKSLFGVGRTAAHTREKATSGPISAPNQRRGVVRRPVTTSPGARRASPRPPLPASAGPRGCTARSVAPGRRPTSGSSPQITARRRSTWSAGTSRSSGRSVITDSTSSPSPRGPISITSESSQSAPTQGQFQSQKRARPSVVRRTLSSRTSVWTRVRPPTTSANPSASAAASAPCARSRTPLTCSQKAGHVARSAGERVELQPGWHRRQQRRHRLERVETRIEVGRAPRTLRRPGLDVLQAEHHPLTVGRPEQAWGRDAGRQRAQLPRLLAVGLREHPLGRLGRGLHEVLRPVRAGEHRRETRRETASLRLRRHHRRPAVLLDVRADGRRQVGPLQPARGTAVRDRRRDRGSHAAILTQPGAGSRAGGGAARPGGVRRRRCGRRPRRCSRRGRGRRRRSSARGTPATAAARGASRRRPPSPRRGTRRPARRSRR